MTTQYTKDGKPFSVLETMANVYTAIANDDVSEETRQHMFDTVNIVNDWEDEIGLVDGLVGFWSKTGNGTYNYCIFDVDTNELVAIPASILGAGMAVCTHGGVQVVIRTECFYRFSIMHFFNEAVEAVLDELGYTESAQVVEG